MGSFLQDIRYGLRVFIHNPIFTVVTLITLALGIGGNVAIFSVVNAILLRPLPYTDADRIMKVWESSRQKKQEQNPVSPPNFLDWREQNQSFDGMSAFVSWNPNLTDGESERLRGVLVSANLFSLLGVEPLLGRSFAHSEDQSGQNQVVMISYSLWQRSFGGDRGLINKPITLNGNSYTVVGIMPPEFDFPPTAEKKELWSPLVFDADDLKGRSTRYLQVVARLKPGVGKDQASADMRAIANRLAGQYPQANDGWSAAMAGLHEQLVGDVRPVLLVMFGAVAFVLLIASANVANLLLARNSIRHREVALRLALGADRTRLIRQLITESVLLALLGGALGVLLAYIGLDFLIAISPEKIPRLQEVQIDSTVLGFTLVVSIVTGLLFGVIPSLQASKPQLHAALKEASRSTAGKTSQRVRNGLVIAEIALAVVLLIGTGLMVKSFFELTNSKLGFNPNQILTAQLSLPSAKYGEGQTQIDFYENLLAKVEAIPGVQAAGVITYLPFSGSNMDWGFSIEGAPPAADGTKPSVEYRQVSTNYFRTMGIRIVKGRSFTERDRADTPGVIIINEALARRYFPNEEVLGKRIGFGRQPDWREIVGVVADVKHFGLQAEAKPEAYVPHLQDPWPEMALVVKSSADPQHLTAAVRSELATIDKDQPAYNISMMGDLIAKSVAVQRLSMLLMSLFAGVALILASVGIYGVIAYSVSQRTHEIGIRMALGAQAGDVIKLVVRQGMTMAAIGIGIGLLASLILTRFISTLLFEVSATDPMIFVGIALGICLLSSLASYLPARKATRVDPIVALRCE